MNGKGNSLNVRGGVGNDLNMGGHGNTANVGDYGSDYASGSRGSDYDVWGCWIQLFCPGKK